MSKRKRPTYGEQHTERLIGPWVRTGAGKVNVRELAEAMEKERTLLKARWNEEIPERRAIPASEADAPSKRRPLREGYSRKEPMSLSDAARRLGVDAKSTRFVERFIDTGRLACEQVSRTRWVFDWADFERVKEQEASARKTDKRRGKRPR